MEFAASQQNPLTRFLPARLRQDDSTAASDFVAAHHASMTWYLSRRLAEAGQLLRDMQEERMKRQLERTRTLGSGATREAVFLGTNQPNLTPPSPAESSASGSWLGNASNLASSFAASIGSSASPFEPSHSAATIKPVTGAAGAGSDWMSETDEEIGRAHV